ncbi:MAG: hypothetical protein GTN39_01370 [Candidatus Aenigmarchaeota archaeon]|nr:hypothetical protein [Candidatus Aenigmarchaeota archaeon]NIQ18227.1 hypothetical protein [Candidatus Aenigmarchaeota archaeon]
MVCIVLTFVSLGILNISSQNYDDEWWSERWRHRFRLDINTSEFYSPNNKTSRIDWPVEYEVNFTNILKELNISGTFDENSTRVIEYNSTGSILWEVKSQFDKDDGYNPTTNAVGVLSFLLNGTTPKNTVRYYYVYFDITENGNKEKPNYSSDLIYSYAGSIEEFNVNNSIMAWFVDTERVENTSGIYHVIDLGTSNEIIKPDPDGRTAEYTKYSNGTNDFGFDFRNNATFKHVGPIRIIVEQIGEETLWNLTENKTGEGLLTKRYVFYSNNVFVKIEQVYENDAGYDISRNSTYASVPGINVNTTFNNPYSNPPYDFPNYSNTTDPGSWAWGAEEQGSWSAGIINLNETGTSNFYAYNDVDNTGRIGITLNTTNISAGGLISQVSFMQFNGTAGDENQIINLKYGLLKNVVLTRDNLEAWQVIVVGRTYNASEVNVSVFNKNETVIFRANVTVDPYDLSKRVNATLDMGTAGTNDDINITLYDGDGDDVYNNSYFLPENASVDLWNVTFWVFNDTWYLLNKSFFTFNVTDDYFINITSVKNKTGFPDRLINVTLEVKNYRRDAWIPNATINCTYDSSEIDQNNITDYNNGTYFIQFFAPSEYKTYVLNCSATKYNNSGLDWDEFTVEGFTTNLSVVSIPSNLTYDNITWYADQSLPIAVNATNLENGSAYYANITLGLPDNITANVTSESCGDILIGKSCERYFSIIVFEGTPAGNYTFNVSVEWRNSDSSYDINTTSVNVTVLPNSILDIVPLPNNKISGIVAKEKEKNIGNFTINSSGNSYLQNITFNISGFDGNFTFELIPPNVSFMVPGELKGVQINLTVSPDVIPGTYNGTLNVTSGNDGWKNITLEVSVSGTNMSIFIDPTNFTAENITWYVNQSFPLFVNTTNTETGVAFDTNITLGLPGNITSNVSNEPCGNVQAGDSCVRYFLITVLNGTLPGNYSVNVSVEWENPEVGKSVNFTLLNITVESNVIFEIAEDNLTGDVTHGTNVNFDNLTLNSSGNDVVINVSLEVTGLGDFNFTFVPLKFNPPNVTNMSAGELHTVLVNVSVPAGYAPGLYNGTLNITTLNAGWKNLSIQVNVPTSRTWIITPDPPYCERPMTPEYGFVCPGNVTINNTGNVQIDFNITPYSSESSPVNYTWTNETSFSINKLESHRFSVLYNATGAPIQFHLTNYTINATQAGSSPDFLILQIVLNPYVKPKVVVGVYPNQTGQNGSIRIFANVTDLSALNPIQNASINITGPNGTSYTAQMDFFGQLADTYKYDIYFPYDADHGLWGDTSLKGIYNVSVISFDIQGKNGTNASSFTIYTKLIVNLGTFRESGIYYQGERGAINYSVEDFTGNPLGSVNATFTIRDPLQNLVVPPDPSTVHTTSSNGRIDIPPEFEIIDDAVFGSYNITTNSSYYEASVNKTVQVMTSYQFEVREDSEVTARVAIPDPSLVSQPMPISVSVLGSGVPSEPDSIDLKVYYTGSIYGLQLVTRPWGNLSKSDFTETSPGFYNYLTEILDENTTQTGTYVAVLEVMLGGKPGWDMEVFRIAAGGPYDVAINLLEGQTYQNDYIDFEIYLENRGEISHTDVKVEYWVSGQNQTWSYQYDYVNVPAFSNRTLVKNLYITPTQPLGTYYVNALVTYDPSQPTASANASFNVVEEGPPTPPGPPGAPGAPAAPAAPEVRAPKIEITKYLQEVGIETGATKYLTVEVENTGGVGLQNVTLRIVGIPTPWIDITPKVVGYLQRGNTSIFNVKLSMPSIAEPKEYFGTLIAEGIARNNKTSDEKIFKIVVFTSREDLVRWEIERLEKALRDFEMDVEEAKGVGKDVSEITPLIDQIKERIDDAKDYLNKKMYDDALSAVYVGWNLLERAKYQLSKAPFIQPLVTFIPPWLIVVLVILVLVIIILLFFVRKIKGRVESIFKLQLPRAKPRTVLVEKIEEKESLAREVASVRRVLNLLEREFKDGLISEKAYGNLKKRNEEKLASLEKKMSELK